MPDVDQNRSEWNEPARWHAAGDEWSVTWGGVEAHWFGALYPRVHAYLPARTVLEIAPGHGRWTQYLRRWCEKLVIVDLSETCINECRKRFATATNIEYHVNDGMSLPMIPDRTIDFAFTFDSLVHAEIDVIDAYLRELARTLSPNGVAFIHHSNAGEYRRRLTLLKRVPHRVLAYLKQLNFDHWRAYSVTAGEVERLARRAGLVCISQELVNWGNRFPVDRCLIDCFSTLTPVHSARARPNRILRNHDFMKEAHLIAAVAPLYPSGGPVRTKETG
ncbi:MAG TPA: class I SAM-dependent methyltransferase [Methylomirabilota bacterium]|jgi:ubiquinone/menaquinone biosynthesis C-methylase UbiE